MYKIHVKKKTLLKDFKKELKISMFINRKTQFFKVSVLSNLNYKFNAIPIKISVSYFVVIHELILKCIWKSKRPQCLILIINDYVTGLCIHCTIVFIIILECTTSTYKKKLTVKQHVVLHRQQSHTSHVYCIS